MALLSSMCILGQKSEEHVNMTHRQKILFLIYWSASISSGQITELNSIDYSITKRGQMHAEHILFKYFLFEK